MTLQIALVGSDGIVVAGDKQISVNQEERIAYGYPASKFRTNGNLLACWAQYEPASEVVRQVLETKGKKLQNIKELLERLGEKVFKQARRGGVEYRNGDVILLDAREKPKLYYLVVRGKLVRCDECDEKAIAGNRVNAGIFFVERFYEGTLPMSKLELLAAHTILSAHKLNAREVRGLEIFRCTDKTINQLKDTEIADLTLKSQEIDNGVRRLLFGSS